MTPRRRTALGSLLATAAVAALAGGLVAGCSPADEVAPDAGPVAEPTGLRVTVEHVEEAVEGAPVEGAPVGAPVAWTSTWRMTWEPVDGAAGYAVRYATSEGRPEREEPDEMLDGPALDVEVAAGTSTVDRLDADRSTGALMTSSQLLVQVAAVDRTGTEGPATPWYAVGDVPDDGVPLPHAHAPEHHD